MRRLISDILILRVLILQYENFMTVFTLTSISLSFIYPSLFFLRFSHTLSLSLSLTRSLSIYLSIYLSISLLEILIFISSCINFLGTIQQITVLLAATVSNWTHLQHLFKTSTEIRKDLPLETTLFSEADIQLKSILHVRTCFLILRN